MPHLQPRQTAVALTTGQSFVLSGVAACIAVTITNPTEVLKTRLQLQGELQHRGQETRVYNGVVDCFVKTFKMEGIRGIQRGLGAAYVYQIALNGARLGFYEPVKRIYERASGKRNALTAMGAGATCGVIGAMLGSPLYLVKTRMQSFSVQPAIAVGAQHRYRNFVDALLSIGRADGLRGLYRGMDAAMLRTGVGSSVQLPSYNYAKGLLKRAGWSEGILLFLASSTASGFCVCAVMQPFDTALTRLYNQPTRLDPKTGKRVGALYRGPMDCLLKTLRAEGIRGLYKGTVAHLARIGPHTVITLSALDYLTSLARRHL